MSGTLTGRFDTVAEIPVEAGSAHVYEHGWQSWSPTGCYRATQRSPRPEHAWQQIMRFRPESPPPDDGFQAEGLLAVHPGPDQPWQLITATDPSRVVSSIRAVLRDGTLRISANADVAVSAHDGLDAALTSYGDELANRLDVQVRPAPTVWCSWYQYFLDVTEADIDENLAALAEHDLPADVIQVDDGWEEGIGDWLTLSDRFRSTRDLAARIRDAGRRPGIWLAPFIAGSRSRLAHDHPDWLTGNAGHNWDQDLHGLDLTHPGVQGYLRQVFENLVDQGYEYFKLDFLYGGALPPAAGVGPDGVHAYRTGLGLVREVVGDRYLVGCGAPLLPSIGLVDAMRVSPDTYNPTDPDNGEDVLRGRPCIEARAWQHGRLWVNDSDCLIARPQFAHRAEWAQVIETYGGLRSVSDRVATLDPWGFQTTRRVLSTVPPPTPFRSLPPLCH